MKHTMFYRSLVLIAAMALMLCGCSKAPTVTTAPPETTTPAQTTAPAETTMPTETQAPADLALGKYLVNEVQLDEGGVSNEDCGITLRPDSICILYMGWGIWYEGAFEIRDSSLICHATKCEWDGGGGPGSREADVTFTFAIREENLLELTEIITEPEELERISANAFSVGMTYSIPPHSP